MTEFCWTQYLGECLPLAEFLGVIIRPFIEQVAIILYISITLILIFGDIEDAQKKI